MENSDVVIKKLELIFQGESVQFNKEEEEIYQIMAKKLKYNNVLKIVFNSYKKRSLDIKSLNSFLQNDPLESFVIQTKK